MEAEGESEVNVNLVVLAHTQQVVIVWMYWNIPEGMGHVHLG